MDPLARRNRPDRREWQLDRESRPLRGARARRANPPTMEFR